MWSSAVAAHPPRGFNVLCILRCFSTHHNCTEWLSEFVNSHRLTQAGIRNETLKERHSWDTRQEGSPYGSGSSYCHKNKYFLRSTINSDGLIHIWLNIYNVIAVLVIHYYHRMITS